MTKKEYILKLLDVISPNVLPIAWDIRLLIEADEISDELIDSLVLIFKNAIDTTTNQREKEKLEKWVNILNALKQREENSKIQDQVDIENLDNLLSQI